MGFHFPQLDYQLSILFKTLQTPCLIYWLHKVETVLYSTFWFGDLSEKKKLCKQWALFLRGKGSSFVCFGALSRYVPPTLTAEATSSGSCTSSPSLQVYKQSITFLFSRRPERIIRPARFPRKNCAMRALPPGYVRMEMTQTHTHRHVERVTHGERVPGLTLSGLESEACRLHVQSWREFWRSCMLVCLPVQGLRPERHRRWAHKHPGHMHQQGEPIPRCGKEMHSIEKCEELKEGKCAWRGLHLKSLHVNKLTAELWDMRTRRTNLKFEAWNNTGPQCCRIAAGCVNPAK